MLENVTGPGAAFHESSETTVCRVPSSYSICSLKIIFGAPVRSGELAVPLARDVEKSVAEHRADRVGALPKPVAHVERNVLHLLIELGPGRIEEVVARLLAVEKQLELAQSADIGRRRRTGLSTVNSRRSSGSLFRPNGLLPRIGLSGPVSNVPLMTISESTSSSSAIHRAPDQSSRSGSPIVKRCAGLHADGLPSGPQTRTLQ